MLRPSMFILTASTLLVVSACSTEGIGDRSDQIESCYHTGFDIKCVSTPGDIAKEARDVDSDGEVDPFVCGDGVSESDSDGDIEDSDSTSAEEDGDDVGDDLDADSESDSDSNSDSDSDCGPSEASESDSLSDLDGDGDADGVSDEDDCDCVDDLPPIDGMKPPIG